MRTPSEREAQGLPNQLPKSRSERAAIMRAAKAAKKATAVVTVGPKNGKDKKVDKDVQELRTIGSAFDTNGDLVEIWERRMLNPDTKQSRPIRIKTPAMHLRWINLSTSGRYQRARYDEGWVPVLKTELVDEREIYGVSYTIEGFVCRGEKQTEMLMKIPEAVWKKIRARKYESVLKTNRQIKENMQAAGARHFSDKYNSNVGDEMAASFDRPPGETGSFRGTVKFGTEQVEPEPGDLEPQAGEEGVEV